MGDPFELPSTCRIIPINNDSILAPSRSVPMTDAASYSPSRMKYLSACSTAPRRNATLAIALAGTLALLIELRETIRRIGPSPDRV